MGSSSVPHPPQFKTSVQHRRANPFQPSKSLSSTQPPQFHTKKVLSVELRGFGCGTEGFLVWNWGGCVELRGFWCWTEGFLGLKRCGPLVELMCWTEGYSNWHYLNTPLVHKHWFYSKYVEAEFKGKDANLWRRVGCSENLGTLFWSKHYFKWIIFVLTLD